MTASPDSTTRIDLASCRSATGSECARQSAEPPSNQASTHRAHVHRTIRPSYSCQPVTSSSRQTHRAPLHAPSPWQIPIAGRAASPRTIARGFVPWRLSDAGRRARGGSCMAGIRNPAHQRKCSEGADEFPVCRAKRTIAKIGRSQCQRTNPLARERAAREGRSE